MSMVLNFVMVLLAGILGSLLFGRLRVPAGAMLGAMCTVALLNCLTDMVYYPPQVRQGIMVLSGAVIGAKVTRSSLKKIKEILGAAAISTIALVVLNFVFGALIYLVSDLDLATSIFAATPGGITDITFIAMEYGAESTSIVFLHMVRLIAAVSVLPFLIQRISGQKAHAQTPAKTEQDCKVQRENGSRIRSTCRTLIIAFVCGGIGYIIRIPGGVLTSAMLGVMFFNVRWDCCYVPPQAGKWLQCFSGLYLGSLVTENFLRQMRTLIMPAGIMVVAVVIWGVVVAGIVNRVTGLDYSTAILACAPGGIQEMSLIGDEMGLDMAAITVIQTVRIVVSVSLVPLLLSIFMEVFLCI